MRMELASPGKDHFGGMQMCLTMTDGVSTCQNQPRQSAIVVPERLDQSVRRWHRPASAEESVCTGLHAKTIERKHKTQVEAETSSILCMNRSLLIAPSSVPTSFEIRFPAEGVDESIDRCISCARNGRQSEFWHSARPGRVGGLNGGPSFIEYARSSGPVPTPSDQLQRRASCTLHPSCMNLCGPWPNDAEWLNAIAHHVESVGSPWLAQDVAVCYAGSKPGYSIQLGYFVAPILTEASLKEAVQRVLEVRAAVKAPLLLEPPPATFRMGHMSMFDWLGQLAEQTDCGLLLDAGHILSHQLVEGHRGWTDCHWSGW